MILFKTTKLWFYHGSQKLMKQKSWTASSMERSIVQGENVKNIAHLGTLLGGIGMRSNCGVSGAFLIFEF